ncbi:hypothetical protein AAE478_004406 [Parahypoxylon ruwenzoriense]
MGAGTSITTPVPAGMSPHAVISVLHDHETYIRTTCPQLISYRAIPPPPLVPLSSSGDSPALDSPRCFKVTDRRPTGQTTYTLTLTNRASGIDSLVDGRAPGTGGRLVISARWRVRVVDGDGDGDKDGDGDREEEEAQGNAVLEEEVEIDSNFIMKTMVRANVERSHPGHHRSFLAEAAKAKP